jgi:hypothetical protein
LLAASSALSNSHKYNTSHLDVNKLKHMNIAGVYTSNLAMPGHQLVFPAATGSNNVCVAFHLNTKQILRAVIDVSLPPQNKTAT